MDVYSQREQRAHGTGFVGIEAETDDKIDNLEVYEALINPRESERGGAGQGGPGMMPPMMGGAGGAGAGGGAGAAGLGGAVAGQATTGAAARIGVMGGAGAAPTGSGPVAASAGVGGGPSLGGVGAGGGGGLPSMPGGPAAAGLPAAAEQEAPAVVAEAEVAPGAPAPPEGPAGRLEAGAGVAVGGGAGLEAVPPDLQGPTRDVIAVDPAAVEQTARQWSSLASEMADISKTASQLQATLEDFGLVRQPAGPYSEVSEGIGVLAGGAAREFDRIATGLNFGAQAYRDHEAQAAQSVRSAQ